MVEIQAPNLAGERIRYNNDTWEFTGDIAFKQNGSLIEANARKPDRVRGSRGIFRFQLQDASASINPGNPGDFDIHIERQAGDVILQLTRAHSSDRYKLKSVRYQ